MTKGRKTMHMNTRRIGPIGTTTRLLAAAGLLYLAFFDGASWGLEWYDAARCRLAGSARLRGDRALERDPRPRRPDRLPTLLADRPGRGTPQRTKVGRRTPAATCRLLD